MDTSLEIRYAVGHETPWNTRTVGASQTNSPRIVARRPDLPGCGATREGVLEFRCPVAAGVSEERVERHPASVAVGAPSPPVSTGAGRRTAAIGARSHRSWVLHQPVDVEANRPPDRETPRGPLHPSWGVEVSAHAVEVELPEAGTPGLATGRSGHRALEAERLAPDKKNSAHLGPISGSSTKAGFCSSPPSVGPGLRWDGLPSTRIVTAGTSSRSLGASRSLPHAHDWDCTSVSTPKTSQGLETIGFLRHLLRHLRGPVVLVWDRGNIHKRQDVKAFLRRHNGRLHVYPFPAYAPELNPAEQVWTHGKRDLSNSTHEDLGTLRPHLRRSFRRIQNSQQLLRSCIEHAELPWP